MMQRKLGSQSTKPLRFRRNPAIHFCMFPKVKSAGCSPADASVYLNVYDLTNANRYVYWAGLGIFHSGVEARLREFMERQSAQFASTEVAR
ncbi:hypothetical protein V6N13_106214 [Hibiscus sabdariffa]